MHIGVLYHPRIPASFGVADDIAVWLRQREVQAWTASSWEPEAVVAHFDHIDLLITLGGDGTLLRAARIAAPHNVPILGVNFGRLGFLAEIERDAWRQHLPRVLSGDYWLEHRLMLRVEAQRGEEVLATSYDALNEVVVSRGNLARVVRIGAHIGDGYLTTYTADGVIVATPTGSTAYALAAGGPILPPELLNILLLPIAPHLSLARPIVLDRGAVVTLKVQTDHSAILTVDGQFQIDLCDGDSVVIASSPHTASFVRLQPRSYFYRTLTDRLKWTT